MVLKNLISSQYLMPFFLARNMFVLLYKGPFKYYVIKEVGGVRKWQFLMIYNTVNHQRVGWVGLKMSKT